ncbi:MAG: tetratricopeptide repeat protein [Candidatus Thermoplasmatota archaeon]|nr:tetratricopeptide repeat protein [Candidatus Thermoplasmatota archaeon]
MTDGSIIEGYRALKTKDLKTAHRIFRSIIGSSADRQNTDDALLGLSITYRELGELDDAIDVAKKVVGSHTDRKIALFDLGNYYEEVGQHALAIQNYDLSITCDPDFSDAYINRGIAWYNLGKMEHARRDFKNGLDIDKRSSRAMANLGIVLLEEKKYEKAIDLFDRSLEEDPENIHALCGKGLALFNLDRYDDSIICFDAALSINPDFYIANYYKGHILKKLDLLEEAEEAINEAIGSRDNYALAWFELGEIYRSRKEDKKALQSYDRAIKIHGDQFEEALFQKGSLLMRSGDLHGAVDSFRKICKSNPYIPVVWIEMGVALSRMKGRKEKAVSALKNALYLKPSDPDASFHLAGLYIEDGQPEKALPVLKKALSFGVDPRIGSLLARTYIMLRMYKEAISAADDVVTKDPDHPEAWLLMGRAYNSLGRTEEYKQCLRKYLHLVPDDDGVRKELGTSS